MGTAAAEPRARDLGIPFPGTPGPLNAITDVAGVEVGYTTLIAGDGKLDVGKGPVRTGVTAVLPRGRQDLSGVFGGYAVGNGNGEMTGTIWIEESGIVGTPILITNTHSVGVVRDSVIAWMLQHGGTEQLWGLPVVAETWDGYLNDLNGFHVQREHVIAALDGARGGAIAEGNVGGGTGMHTFEFKGGTGTSSRRVRVHGIADYTVGVLVQSNFGRRSQLQVAGIPIGRDWPDDRAVHEGERPRQRTRFDHRRRRDRRAAAADATQAHRAARCDGYRAYRWHGGQRLGRHLPGVLHGEFGRSHRDGRPAAGCLRSERPARRPV